MPKLSHYCPKTNYIIYYANPNGRSISIGDGIQTNRQKTPNLGSIFLPNYSQYSCSTTGHLSPISTKIFSKSLHNVAKISYLCQNFHATFMQKLIYTRFAIGLKNSLSSAYTLKRQPSNTSNLFYPQNTYEHCIHNPKYLASQGTKPLELASTKYS